MVNFPSLLSKLGIQKFLIEDSSMSDKVVPGTLSLTGHLKKIFFNLFSIGGELLYHIVLAPAIQQHESAIGIYVCPFPLEPPSHPPPHATRSGLSQSTMLSSLHHTANSHWLSVLHTVVCMLPLDVGCMCGVCVVYVWCMCGVCVVYVIYMCVLCGMYLCAVCV